ncbi:MAG: aminoglycoside phosphotransferase family protein [Ardenticatenales bacterium]|nr:aminoglycoside phosphotransferase family protein [Ardenticatenales bacterium]
MTATQMHKNEVPTSAALVQQLLAAQFPQWADLPIQRVPSSGTDNALYRAGDELLVRLPRIDWATEQADKERYWLPRLAPHLPLRLPEQLAMGEPGAGYPWSWAIYRWLPGQSARLDILAEPKQAATDLARFIQALQAIPTDGGPDAVTHELRGQSLQWRDEDTRAAIAEMAGLIDTAAALRVWEEALAAPEWAGSPVWFHGDLLAGNVLVHDGQVSAIIDFSGLGVGDPAPDMLIAWNLFAGASRDWFRRELAVDEATWARGRGQALAQAAMFIPYYLHTNPGGVAAAQRALAQLLDE